MDWAVYSGLWAPLLVVVVLAWAFSLVRNDVSFVDSLWSLFFLMIAGGYYLLASDQGPRATLLPRTWYIC